MCVGPGAPGRRPRVGPARAAQGAAAAASRGAACPSRHSPRARAAARQTPRRLRLPPPQPAAPAWKRRVFKAFESIDLARSRREEGTSFKLETAPGWEAPCCWWRCRALKLTAVADSVRNVLPLGRAQVRARGKPSPFWRDLPRGRGGASGGGLPSRTQRQEAGFLSQTSGRPRSHPLARGRHVKIRGRCCSGRRVRRL